MSIIKSYIIELRTLDNVLLLSLPIDAFNKKEAKRLGEEIKNSLLPIIQKHYDSMSLAGPKTLKVHIK